jgi:hypothetical protein
MKMALNFFRRTEGVIEPGAQFPKKRAWPFLSGSAPPGGIKRVQLANFRSNGDFYPKTFGFMNVISLLFFPQNETK